MNNLADTLKNLRKSANISQSELAEKLNVHLQTVSKWERGISEPDIGVLGDICVTLNTNLESLACISVKETYSGTFNAVSLGRLIADLRKSKGESQEELGKAVNVSGDTVSKWERGVVCPNFQSLICLSQYFDIPLSKLYFAINDVDETVNVAIIGKKRNYKWLWLSILSALCAVAVMLAVFLPILLQGDKVYVVTIGNQTYNVRQNDWFSPVTPYKDGYDFTGFADNQGKPVAFPCKITEDVTFIPQFTPRSYTIDYWLNGGSFSQSVDTTFTVEDDLISLPIPSKVGCQFEGWYLTPDYQGESITALSCNAQDVAVYAKYSDGVYAVRYQLNGGSLQDNNPTLVTGEQQYLLNNPVRKGFKFLGWYDAPQNGNRYETVGGSHAQNLTLYALWQQSDDVYDITYNLDGGSLQTPNPTKITVGEVYSLHQPIKQGYDFVCWNDKPDNSGTAYTALYGIQHDLTLYAIYQPKIYTVVYNLNGGTYYDGVNDNHLAFGGIYTLEPLIKFGYEFVGWFDAETGGNKVEQLDNSNLIATHVLYARFNALTYTINLNANGGYMVIDGIEKETHSYALQLGDKQVLPQCQLAGQVFVSWQTEDGEAFDKIDESNIGNLNLFAAYRPADWRYNITFELNGGQCDSLPETVACHQVVKLSTPTRSGYIFVGWNDKLDGSGQYYQQTSADRETDLRLYAIWQEVVVTGSSKDFLYEKGQTFVSITGYKGEFGENVDIVIPSYIDGLPVTKIASFIYFNGEGFSEGGEYNSITIPNTVKTIASRAFYSIILHDTVVIPSSVSFIEEYAFKNFVGSIVFEYGSSLTEIARYAFCNAQLLSTLILPEGIQTVKQGAFSQCRLYSYTRPTDDIQASGIILPQTLTCIESEAFKNCDAIIYLPSSVRRIENGAFDGQIVYTTLPSDNDFALENAVYFSPALITLVDTGETFNNVAPLPVRHKDGFTFVGWRKVGGDIVPRFYAAVDGNVTLEPIFEDVGRDISCPAVFEVGQTYSIVVYQVRDENFSTSYCFTINCPEDARVKITMEAHYLNNPNGVESGVSIYQCLPDAEFFSYLETPMISNGLYFTPFNGCLYRIVVDDFEPHVTANFYTLVTITIEY